MDASYPFIKEFERLVFTPDSITPVYAQSVGDENIFANRLKIPMLIIGPIRDNTHSANEWISLKSLYKIEKVYEKLLQIYCTFDQKSVI